LVGWFLVNRRLGPKDSGAMLHGIQQVGMARAPLGNVRDVHDPIVSYMLHRVRMRVRIRIRVRIKVRVRVVEWVGRVVSCSVNQNCR
jgi:hypothetical protein